MADSQHQLITRLSSQLDDPLPGHQAHLMMAPRYPARQKDVSVDGRNCREAGVLVLVVPHDDELAVVLTVRRDHLPDHGGQISFPGGQREGNESLRATALREAEEEINLDSANARIVGSLTPLYIPPSNFCVYPFVGTTEESPVFRPTDREVHKVLQVPLAQLLDPSTREVEVWTLHDEDIEVPFYAVAERRVWGATAMMLAEFLEVVRTVKRTRST